MKTEMASEYLLVFCPKKGCKRAGFPGQPVKINDPEKFLTPKTLEKNSNCAVSNFNQIQFMVSSCFISKTSHPIWYHTGRSKATGGLFGPGDTRCEPGTQGVLTKVSAD